MPVDLDLAAKLLAPAVSVLGIYAAWSKRPKLVAFMVHATGIPFEKGAVHTHTVVVRNNGREPAVNVRLVHSNLPHFAIFPPRPHTVERYEGGADILVSRLVPKDQFTVSYLYGPPMTFRDVNTIVKSDEGLAKVMPVIPSPIVPRSAQLLFVTLILIGASVVAYYAIVGIGRLLGIG